MADASPAVGILVKEIPVAHGVDGENIGWNKDKPFGGFVGGLCRERIEGQ